MWLRVPHRVIKVMLEDSSANECFYLVRFSVTSDFPGQHSARAAMPPKH